MKKLVCIDNPIQCPHRKMYGGLMLCEHVKTIIPGYVKVCPQVSSFADSCPLLNYDKDVVTDSLLFTAEEKEGTPVQITSIDKKPDPEQKKQSIFRKPKVAEKKVKEKNTVPDKKTLSVWSPEETAVIAVAKDVDEAKLRYAYEFGNKRSCDSVRLKWVYMRNAGQLFHKGSKVTVIREDCIDYGKVGTIFRLSDDRQYAVIDLGNNVMVSHKLSYLKSVQ